MPHRRRADRVGSDPGVPLGTRTVCYAYICVCISVKLGLDGQMRQKVRFVPGHPMLKTRRIARRRQFWEMKSHMTGSGAPWCQRGAERDGLRD